jgi:hypothetical protein
MCFKRYNTFAEAFNSTIKDIHLALEVKAFFATLHLQRALVRNPTLRSLNFPLIAVNGIAEKESERETYTRQLKAKIERLRSARLT